MLVHVYSRVRVRVRVRIRVRIRVGMICLWTSAVKPLTLTDLLGGRLQESLRLV